MKRKQSTLLNQKRSVSDFPDRLANLPLRDDYFRFEEVVVTRNIGAPLVGGKALIIAKGQKGTYLGEVYFAPWNDRKSVVRFEGGKVAYLKAEEYEHFS